MPLAVSRLVGPTRVNPCIQEPLPLEVMVKMGLNRLKALIITLFLVTGLMITFLLTITFSL